MEKTEFTKKLKELMNMDKNALVEDIYVEIKGHSEFPVLQIEFKGGGVRTTRLKDTSFEEIYRAAGREVWR